MAFRPFMLAAVVLPLSLLACGGDADGTITPEGEHYKYVVNQAFLPANNNQARDYGIDLDGNGQPDNQLGMVLGILTAQGLDVQTTVETAVAEGSILLLADVQTTNFMNTAAAGISIFLGASPTPAACNAGETYDPMAKTGCKRHLDGNGSFSLAAGAKTDTVLGGKIVNGTFNGGPGDVTLQIALGGTEAIELNLIGARIKASAISETGIGSGTSGGLIVGGAVTKGDIDNEIIPAIQSQLGPTIAMDCPTPGAADCGCEAGSTGETVLNLFDSAPKDCMVTVEEIKTNSLIMTLLAPDVTIDGQQALSIGLKATAVKATFTVPGQ